MCFFHYVVNSGMTLDFSSRQLEPLLQRNLTFGGKSSLHIDSVDSKTSVDSLIIISPETFEVNATLLSLNVTGRQRNQCELGGLFGFVFSGQTPVDTPTVCNSHNSHSSQSKSLYSKHSVLIVVGFSFQGNGFEANMSLSLTECKLVQVCPCGPVHWDRRQPYTDILCDADAHSSLSFHLRGIDHNVDNGTCLVFQTNTEDSFLNLNRGDYSVDMERYSWTCSFHLRPNVMQEQKQIEYLIRGQFFSKIIYDELSWKTVSCNCLQKAKDSIIVSGLTDVLCGIQNTSGQNTCAQPRKLPSKHSKFPVMIFEESQINFIPMNLLLSVRRKFDKIPKYSTSPVSIRIRNDFSLSWVEVVVRQTVFHNQVELTEWFQSYNQNTFLLSLQQVHTKCEKSVVRIR